MLIKAREALLCQSSGKLSFAYFYRTAPLVNPIVAAIDSCESASEIFAALNRFSAWMHRTRPDFCAHAPLPIRSARDIVAWRVAVRLATKQRKRSERLFEDLSYVEEVLYASWRKLEALHDA